MSLKTKGPDGSAYHGTAQVVNVVDNQSRGGNVREIRPGFTVTAISHDDMFTWITPWPPELNSYVNVTITEAGDG